MPQLDFDAKEYGKFIIDAQGTPYMMVAGRLVLAHKSGQLIGAETEKIYEDAEVLQVKATVSIFNPETFAKATEAGMTQQNAGIVATQTFSGMAESDKGASNAEGKRPLEVAETSAIGRALGIAGFGPLDSIASAEEIFTLLSNERKGFGGGGAGGGGGKLTEGQEKFLKDLIQQKLGTDPDSASLEKFGKTFDKITRREGSPWIEELKTMPGKGGGRRKAAADF